MGPRDASKKRTKTGKRSAGLTVKGIEGLAPGAWLADKGRRNAGTLRAKGGTQGARFYFRYRDPAGAYVDLPVGAFDNDGHRGMTLAEAQDRAGELSRRYRAGETDLRGALGMEQRQREAEIEHSKRAAESKAVRDQATLGALLLAYSEGLKAAGKIRWRDVESASRRHVEKPWPNLWSKPAADITLDDGLDIVSRLVKAGTRREAAKVRSYLRGAFSAAIRARQDPSGLPALRALRIAANPMSDLVTITGASKVRDRVLSVVELRAYWKRIEFLPGADGAMLRFHLLTGGQRVDQLARATIADVDTADKTLLLRDHKGKRDEPRMHIVPLLPEALAAIETMASPRLGPFIFTTTNGQSGMTYQSLRARFWTVADAMIDANEITERFTPGDIRRTVETRLAGAGVSREVRAQLQSHGISGVQARHYDRYSYADEKRAALVTLFDLVTGTDATVTPIRPPKRKGAVA